MIELWIILGFIGIGIILIAGINVIFEQLDEIKQEIKKNR
jgi:hypothetical protein